MCLTFSFFFILLYLCFRNYIGMRECRVSVLKRETEHFFDACKESRKIKRNVAENGNNC